MIAGINGLRGIFPDKVPLKAAQGFIVTAVINTVFGSSAKVALLGGAIAATATIIEAITRPIIDGLFYKNGRIRLIIQIVVPPAIALGLAASIASWLGVAYKMNSGLIPIIGWLALNSSGLEKNEAMAVVL